MKDEKLKEIINNKTIWLLLPGASILELEFKIKDWEKYLSNICFAGINFFNIIENNILMKLDKGRYFDIVFDCSDVMNDSLYEQKIRIPRFKEYLNRPQNNRLITAHQIVNNMDSIMSNAVLNTWMDKITYIEPYIEKYWKTATNSLSLYLMMLTLFGAKKIILFGADGWKGNSYHPEENVNAYYKKEMIMWERSIAFNDPYKCNLYSESLDFNTSFSKMFMWFCSEKKVVPPIILNCSKLKHGTEYVTMFNIFPIIDYGQVVEESK